MNKRLPLEDGKAPRSPLSFSKALLTLVLGFFEVRGGWGSKDVVYISTRGMSCSQKVENGLKLLFRVVNKHLGTIRHWIKGFRRTLLGIAY
jgi:hypothetical protein